MAKIASVGQIPKGLEALGVTKGFDPTPVNQSRIVLAGKPGVGKSTFLASNPDAIILDLDRGSGTVADPQSMRFKVPTATPLGDVAGKMQDAVQVLIDMRNAGDDSVQMVIIDTLDSWIDAISYEMLAQNPGISDVGDMPPGHGKGWRMLRTKITDTLDRLHQAGMGWAIVSHIAPKTIRTSSGEVQRYALACSEGVKNGIMSRCEHLLFIERGTTSVEGPGKEVEVNGKKKILPGKKVVEKVRWLKSIPGGLWRGDETDDVKVRVPLPEQIVIPSTGGWDTFSQAYTEAVDKLMAGKAAKEL